MRFYFYLQESNNNKFFAKGGKQNPKSPKSPNNESTNIEDDADKETDKDSTAKSVSKHQLKSARKAERVSDTTLNMTSIDFQTSSELGAPGAPVMPSELEEIRSLAVELKIVKKIFH